MIRLVQLELKKIFHKRSIYILFGIMAVFCFLNNYLYYLDYDEEGFYRHSENDSLKEKRDSLVKELSLYDIHKESDITMYLTLKSKIDILDLKSNFDYDTWQYQLLDDYLYSLVYQMNMYQYLSLDDNTYVRLKNEFLYKKEQLFKDNWKYFIRLEISEKELRIAELEKKKEGIKDIYKIKDIEKEINELKNSIQVFNYRIFHNIKIEKGYLNQALEELEHEKSIKEELERRYSKLSDKEKVIYQDAISKIKIDEYILKTKKNINKENTVLNGLRTISEDYEIFIVLLIIIVASMMVCEEFIKGTIKLLLIKPYSRVKILLSKYYATLFVLVLCFLFLIGIELIIGIPFLGVSSLKMPVVVYHLEKKQLIEYSVFSYMFIRMIARMPFFVMILTITFTISVISTNTVLSFAIPMIVYLFESFIKNLMIEHHIKWLRYFISMNWHFEDYLFGNELTSFGIHRNFSIIIWFSYFVILMILTVRCFKRKDIKNI